MSRISGCSAIAVHTDTIRVDASKHPRNAQPAQPLHLKFLIDASDVTIMNRAASTTTNRTKLHVGDVSSMASLDDIGSMASLDYIGSMASLDYIGSMASLDYIGSMASLDLAYFRGYR